MKKIPLPKVCIIFLCICAGLSVFLALFWSAMNFSPWNSSGRIELPTYADNNGGWRAVVENSEKSVLVMDQTNTLIYQLKAGQSFSAVKFIALDDLNNLYVLDVNFNGYMEENVERVLRYSPTGKFLGEPYTFPYINEDFIITKGKIAGMTCFDGAVYLVRLDSDGFWLEQVETGNRDETSEAVFFPYPHAFRDLVYFHISPEDGLLTATTMAGGIKQYSFSGELLFEAAPEGNSLPWTAVSEGRNSVIYSDLTSKEIVRFDLFSLDTADRSRTTLFAAPPDGSPYYRINYKDGALIAASLDNLLVLDEGGAEIIDSYTWSFSGRFVRFLWFVLFITALLAFAVLLAVLVLLLRGKNPGAIFARIALITLGITLGAFLASFLIIDEMSEQYYSQIYNELENVSRLMAMNVDTDVMKSLEVPSHYDKETYINLKEDMLQRFSRLPFKGKGIYQILWEERDGVVYMMYDLESSTGIFYPFADYEESIYQEVITSREYIHTRETTSEGSWLMVLGPIFDSEGNITALIETGYMMSIVQEQMRSMVIQTVLIVLASTVALLLIVIEINLFSGARKKNKDALTRKALLYQPGQIKSVIAFLIDTLKKTEKEHTAREVPAPDSRLLRAVVGSLAKTYRENSVADRSLPFRPELLRALVFFLFGTCNLASAILPMHAANLYRPFLGLPKELLVTLPMTADFTCTALALLVIPLALGKVGIKRVGFIAAVLMVAGNVLCFIAPDTLFLSIGYALNGFACGALILVSNTAIGAQKSELDVNSGFAHFNASYLAGVNVGVVLGSILAQFFPYRLVFLFSSISALALLAVTFFSFRSKTVGYLYEVNYAKETKGKKFALLRFLFNPVVPASLFLLLMPYSVSLSFTSYFMPVFGMENGLKESNIGQLILLSGLFAILFGTSLCEYVRDKFSVKMIIFVSMLLNIGAILLFSFNVSIEMLVAAVVLIAVANIFILTNIETFYAALYQNADVSPMKALSVFSAVENLSMSIGPVIFSYILAGNTGTGLRVYAGAFLVCLLVFMAVSGLRRGKQHV